MRTRKGEAQRYREQTDGRARKASTNRNWTTLRAALNFAFHEGKIPSDAAWRRIKPFRSVDNPRQRFLTVDEARRLINAADPAFRPLVQAALMTGARYGELCALTVADFSLDNGTVHIQRSKTGKGRHIHLTDEGRALFERLTAGRAGTESMFGQWTKSAQLRPMRAAVTAARISPPISFHGLRHSFASHAVMNGTPLFVVAQHLGHADTRMTERVYGHMSRSYVADAIRAGAPTFGDAGPDTVVTLAAGRSGMR